MNKSLFKTESKQQKKINSAVPNAAGGISYELSAETALCCFAVTSCFNQTFYATAESQVEKVKELLNKVRPGLVAKVAVYAHQQGAMKDMPAYLLAYLFAKGETTLVKSIFSRVVTNSKMLCNFVQLVRSGAHGRKSFGTVGKTLIQNWLQSRSPEQLFKDSVGHSNPSLVDIIKMVHPKFSDGQQNVVRYLMGKESSLDGLPSLVKTFEGLKKGEDLSPEGLDFRLLSNLSLSTNQWEKLGLGMTWNALRMNLNNLQKHGVFQTNSTPALAEKLANHESVKRANAFPYQLLTTYQNIDGVPDLIKKALESALGVATENVPNLGRVAVAIDVSGSMSSPATGNRPGASTKTSCVDVAALVASCILRTSDEVVVLPFDTAVRSIDVNRYDSVLTNSHKLSIRGGGTNCSLAMRKLYEDRWDGDVVFYVSDNMSWYDYNGRAGSTVMRDYWAKIRGYNTKAKLILLDITPNSQSQHYEDGQVLHVGGFSDAVWEVVKNFVHNNGKFLDVIESVAL